MRIAKRQNRPEGLGERITKAARKRAMIQLAHYNALMAQGIRLTRFQQERLAALQEKTDDSAIGRLTGNA